MNVIGDFCDCYSGYTSNSTLLKPKPSLVIWAVAYFVSIKLTGRLVPSIHSPEQFFVLGYLPKVLANSYTSRKTVCCAITY